MSRSTRLLPNEFFKPLDYLGPNFHMSPLDTSYVDKNATLFLKSTRRRSLNWKSALGSLASGYKGFQLTYNGREAIRLALKDIAPKREDEVLIVTSTQGPYVSGCVTKTIEEFCGHSRTLSPRTKIIFVIHEFGFPAHLSEDLKALKLPIIEDCAYGLGLGLFDKNHERLGDYVVYSFSKSFPLPYGGLLKSRKPLKSSSPQLSDSGTHFLFTLLPSYLKQLKSSCQKRRQTYALFTKKFAEKGLSPRFQTDPKAVPHSFVLALEDETLGQQLKPILNGLIGIESSVFYGNRGYFLPCHFNLGPASVDYIVTCVSEALNNLKSKPS